MNEINKPEKQMDAPKVEQRPEQLREQANRSESFARNLDEAHSIDFNDSESESIRHGSISDENKALQDLSQYMKSHDYGPGDFNTYSKNPEWQALQKRAFPDYKLPLIEGTQHIEEISSWIKDINPNFDEFDINSPYSHNCGSCALSVYQRLEGDSTACASSENIRYKEEMESLTGMKQVEMSPDNIKKYLIEQGNGAHVIIGVDRFDGPGHWFNAICIDGDIKVLDGQNGTISDWPPDYGNVSCWDVSIKKENLDE